MLQLLCQCRLCSYLTGFRSKVLITPHVSGASDDERHGAIGIFCENLRAYLDGRPLRNVIDWARGY